MKSIAQQISETYKKHAVVDVKSGDTVKVHQKIKEGNKERIQIFEGLVLRTDRMNSATASITVRRIASGIGVEKSYLLHSPLVMKIEVTKRGKVRRNYLSYMRDLRGKSARLVGKDFDKNAVNTLPADQKAIEAEEALKAEAEQAHAEDEARKQAEKEAEETKVKEALANRENA